MAIDPELFAKVAKVYEAAESVEGMKPKEVYESHQKCAPGEFGMHKDGEPSGEAKNEKQSFMVGGTVGALGGLATSKKNERGRGVGRGALIGAGTELGMYPGAAVGGVGGLALGGLLSALMRRDGMHPADMLAGGALGAGAGAVGGGYLGNIGARALLDGNNASNHEDEDEKAAADPRAMQINEGGPYTGPTPIANNYLSGLKNVGRQMQRGALGGAIAAPVVGSAAGRALAGGAGAVAGRAAGGLLGQQLQHVGAQSAVEFGARAPNKPIPYGLMDGKLTNRPSADSVKGYFDNQATAQGFSRMEENLNAAPSMIKTQSARAFGEKAAASINWQNIMNTGLGGAALGAGLGGLAGLVAPGEDENGRRRSRFGAMLRGALGGGLMGGGAGAAAEAASPGFGQSAVNMARNYGGDLYQQLFGKKQPEVGYVGDINVSPDTAMA